MKPVLIRQTTIVGIVLSLTIQAQAQVTLDRLFPPIVAAGETTTVQAEGKFPNWPPLVHCDRDDLTITPENDSGKLKIKVPDQTHSGVAWIRLHDKQSASSLVPLLVSAAPVTRESEPNDQQSDANVLSLPTVVAGRLAKNGDSDAYRVTVKAEQRLVLSVTAHQILKSPMDAVLQLSDIRGNVLVQSDDVRGLDPQIVYRSRVDQDLLVRLFAFPETPNSTVGFAGSASFIYTIDVTTGPFVDHFAETESKVIPFGHNLPQTPEIHRAETTQISPAVASIGTGLGWNWLNSSDPAVNRYQSGDGQEVTLPASVTGHISKPGESHTFRFVLSKGTRYRFSVRSKPDGFLLDSKLELVDRSSGQVLASNDDKSRGGNDSELDFTAKEDQELELRLSDMVDSFGPRHFYRISIQEVISAFELSVSADRFAIKHDTPLEIPVAILRESGFAERIQIAATGLPESITVEPVISEPKGATAKSVKLKLVCKDGPQANDKQPQTWATFQVTGTILKDDAQAEQRTQFASFPLRPVVALKHFWLSIIPSPESQPIDNEPPGDKGNKS